MRIAMRALLGLDPDDRGSGATAAREFERALAFYGTDYTTAGAARSGVAVAPAAQRSQGARPDRVPGDRRAAARPARAATTCSAMLMAATDEDGSTLSDREVRDQAVTLLFAGPRHLHLHDLLPALRAGPQPARAATCSRPSRTSVLAGSDPTPAQLAGGLPRLEMALDETLRHVPARVDRPAAGAGALRGGRHARRRRHVRELLLVGEPPPARRLRRPVPVRLRALRARAQGGAARRAPTCRSAAGRAPASACASGRWR